MNKTGKMQTFERTSDSKENKQMDSQRNQASSLTQSPESQTEDLTLDTFPSYLNQKDPFGLYTFPCDLQQTADGQQCCFWRAAASPFNPAMHTVVVQCSPGGGLMYISHCEAFSCLEVTLGSFMTLWTITRLTLRVIFDCAACILQKIQ